MISSLISALIFQSTLSVRRATDAIPGASGKLQISIHALRKESDFSFHLLQCLVDISIHALRKESDDAVRYVRFIDVISIHALRKESDFFRHYRVPTQVNFNPRSP